MAWSGGNFTRANPTWVSDASAGIGIEAARHDNQDNDFTTGINECLNKTGQNAMTGTLSMGSNKISNLAAGTLRNDAAQVGQVQDGDFIWLGTTGGTATAQTATATPAITAYKAGQKFRLITGFNSTGSAVTQHTLNINGIGAKDITNQDNTNLTTGSFLSGAILEVLYDGTRFKMTNDAGGWSTWTPNLRSGTATITTPDYPLALFRKQGKTVTCLFQITFAVTGAGSTILCDLPTNNADTGVTWLQSTFATFDTAIHIGQAYVNVTANELIVQKNVLVATNWSVVAAPGGGFRGVLTYRSV